MSRLLQSHGFRVVRAGPVYNRYALRYVVRLAPLPPALKRPAVALTGRTFLGAARLWLPLGNLYAVAEKTKATTKNYEIFTTEPNLDA